MIIKRPSIFNIHFLFQLQHQRVQLEARAHVRDAAWGHARSVQLRPRGGVVVAGAVLPVRGLFGGVAGLGGLGGLGGAQEKGEHENGEENKKALMCIENIFLCENMNDIHEHTLKKCFGTVDSA